ncbi:MAG: T9SS type A sorting domain-containing protein [Bacteroidota bacterium]
MKTFYLITFLSFIFLTKIYAQCPDETYNNIGDFSFNELVKVEATDQVFGVVFVSDTITIEGQNYFSENDSLSKKVIVELDLEGNYVNSFEVFSDYEFVAETFDNGYRNAGLVVDDSQIIVPSIYINEFNRLVYNVQSYDFNGNINWSKDFSASLNRGIYYGFDEAIFKQNGNLLLSGSFADTLNVDNQEFINTDQSTGFLLELDATTGDYINLTEILGSNQMEFYNLKEDSSENLYVAGNIQSADSIVVNGNTTNYTGSNSGHIFKLDNRGLFQWFHIFESDFLVENFPLHVDESNSFIHYGAVHYESGGQDNTITDAWIGALNMTDGAIAWEHELAARNWYYLAYESWIDVGENAIYFPIWANNGGINEIYMDGELLQDSISSRTILHKFSLDGTSEWISPIRFSSSKGIIDRGDGTVLAPINYAATPGTRANNTGVINPANYPLDWTYLFNDGGNTTSTAKLKASSSGETSAIQWYLNGDSIDNPDDSILSPTEPGSYWVDIQNSNGCISRSEGINIMPGENSQSDSLALVELYNATDGANWNDNTGWLELPLSDWFGVQLNAEGRIRYIDLNSNNLNGTLPSAFQDMTALQEIFLYNNPNLSGDFQDLILNKNDLLRIRAHDCNFSGEIPSEITTHTNLTDIAMAQNSISGNIPTDIGNLTSLTELSMWNNDVEGAIPTSIGNLTNLQGLDFGNNNLEGEIPSEIENLTNLNNLALYGNQLEGDIGFITAFANIDLIALSRNNFTGEIPPTINTLTNIYELNLDGNDLSGNLPIELGDLTNLIQFKIGNNNFTGEIPTELSNWTLLEDFSISGNDFEGAFDIQISDSIRVINISNNSFTSVGDYSNKANLISLFVSRNFLDFDELLKNLTVREYDYSPQKPFGEFSTIEISFGDNQTFSSPIPENADASYQWLLNRDTITSASGNEYTVNNFSTSDAGDYTVQASHPDLDVVLNSAATRLKILSDNKRWYVDNRTGKSTDFKDLRKAILGSGAGDTIYIAGSTEVYKGVNIQEPKVLLGPGYFLDQNPNTQFNTDSAVVQGLSLSQFENEQQISDPAGTIINGLVLNNLSLQNNITAEDTLQNIEIKHNNIGFAFIAGNTKNIDFSSNFVDTVSVVGILGNTLDAYYKINFENNIVDLFTNYNTSTFDETLNNLTEFNINYNTIRQISEVNDFTFENSLYENDGTNGANTFNNSQQGDFNTLLENNSNSFSVDNDFQPINEPNLGAFSGNTPYKLSGIPPIPSIYDIQIGDKLSAIVSSKSNNGNQISRLRYIYRQNNQSTSPFNLSQFQQSEDVTIEFLPNRSVIQANESYDLVFVAIDETGKRSHRTYIPYETIATTLSGNVVDIENIEVTQGDVKLFSINPYANKYDTAAVQNLNNDNNFNFEDLILGDYIILANPDKEEFPNLIPTYLGNTIDWEVADTINLDNSVSEITIEVEKEPEQLTDPGSEISGVVEEEYEEADSSLRILPRRKVSGAGVSVRKLVGSSRPESSLRLNEDDYELMAYIKSDENGEFSFPSLPTGDYKIRVEYPGVENDETSDINFNLSGEQGEVVSVEALVEDGKIKVTETGRVTANEPDNMVSFSFYPNPVKNVMNLKLENADEPHEITIFDLKGVVYKKIQLENNQRKIDLNDLPTGSYILRLQDKKGNYIMSKIIKE